MLRLPYEYQLIGPLKIKKRKMSSGGRPKDAIWHEFTRLKKGERFRAKCRKCAQEMEVLTELDMLLVLF